MTYIVSDRIFNKNEQLESIEPGATFEQCVFQNLDFGDRSLTDLIFADCDFLECRFNMNETIKTGFQNVKFNRCKLMGIQFEDCSPLLLEMKFSESKVEYCHFQNLKVQTIEFTNCSLIESDFYSANLTGAKILGCDLQGAIFENTILEKCDLSQSYNFSIDPDLNYIQGAKFTLSSLPGLLDKYGVLIDD